MIAVGVDNPENLDFTDVEHYDHISEENLEELYKNARLFVYVSDTEAFGLPPLEALAWGGDRWLLILTFLMNYSAMMRSTAIPRLTASLMESVEASASANQHPSIAFLGKIIDRFIKLCRNI